MITPALVTLALALSVQAHGHGHHHAAVMARAAASGSTTSTTTKAATTTTTSASSASSTSSAAATTTTTTAAAGVLSTPSGVTVSTASNAVPLASIVPNSLTTSDTNLPTYSTPAAGSKPTNLASAPALPDISTWSSMQANYPSADPTVALDTTTSEVQEWIQQVKDSGITIPNIQPRAYTLDGNNCELPESLARESSWESDGWWTCGHYTRSTDIVECTTSGVWGSSFDDGPSDYSANVLDYMAENSLSTTFFAVGTAIYWRPTMLQAEYIAGHQIAVHTWNHHALTNLTNEQVIAELGWTKKIIKDVLGVTPMYMRPPYGDIDDRVRAISMAMNLTPVMWTVTGTESNPFPFDTFDWEVPGGDVTATASVNQFYLLIQNAIQYAKGFIVLEHDLYPQEVDLGLGYFLPTARANGFKIEPVYQCAGQTLENAYAETATNGGALPGGSTGSTNTTSSSTSPNGTTTSSGSSSTGSGKGAATGLREGLPVVMALVLSGAMAVAASL